MARRKTPREKKELDYDKERRTHWDSQKAARKAIPAAKQYASQVIRKRSHELIDTTLSDSETELTASELAALSGKLRYRPYFGHRETLREHVAHQQKDRRGPKRQPFVSGPTGYGLLSDAQRLSAYLQQAYAPANDEQFMEFLRRWEAVTRGHGGKQWNRRVAEVLSRERNGSFITAFLRDNPRWARRIDAIIKRGLPRKDA